MFSSDPQCFRSTGGFLRKAKFPCFAPLKCGSLKRCCGSYMTSALTFKFSLQPSAHSCAIHPPTPHTHTHTPLSLMRSPCRALQVGACPRADSPSAPLEAGSASPACSSASLSPPPLSHRASIECHFLPRPRPRHLPLPFHCGH